MRQGDDSMASGWRGEPLRHRHPARLESATVFSSPHSGRIYPDGFVRRSRLDLPRLRASEDAFVDDLFARATICGAPLIAAAFPRAWLDVNRAADELDPSLIADVTPRRARTLRVSAGLGVVPRIVAEGVAIYDGKLSLDEARARIEACHRPYHAALSHALLRARATFGTALLIDCHSMPSEKPKFGARRSEIVIGDCYGSSASAEISDAVFAIFRRAGFRVARNVPFAGGYITQRHGRPFEGVHAIQIEIDRGLYLDQQRIEPGAGFGDLRAALAPVIEALCALPHSLGRALAAE